MSYDEEAQLTKKQRREEARAQRKALEAAEHAGVARRKRLASIDPHDASRVIRTGSCERYPFTLGQFLTVWGSKFTNTQLGSYVAGNGNVLSVYVNGKPGANPVGYVMKPHDGIIVAYGKPGSSPTGFEYDWASARL